MKEGQPITPLSEAEIEARPAQLSNALSQIRTAEEVVLNSPNQEYVLEGCRNGQKEHIIVDAQVIQAMKGGASRMYDDVKLHYDGLAQTIHRSYVPEGYQPPVPVRKRR